LLNY
jgi:hypothetical protein